MKRVKATNLRELEEGAKKVRTLDLSANEELEFTPPSSSSTLLSPPPPRIFSNKRPRVSSGGAYKDDDVMLSPRIRLGMGNLTEAAIVPVNCLRGYELVGEIGSGTTGTVYKARSPVKKSRTTLFANEESEPPPTMRVAIKVQLDSPAFEAEAKMYKRFANLGIAPTFIEAWACDGVGILATEEWDGSMSDLDIWTLPPAMLYKLRVLVSRLHEAGFVHGDIMPKNILLRLRDDDRQVVDVALTDFGLAEPIQGWRENTRDFMRTMWNYYLNPKNVETRAYFLRERIGVDDIMRDPTIMDYAFVNALADESKPART